MNMLKILILIKLKKKYSTLLQSMKSAESKKDFIDIEKDFESLKDYKDAVKQAEICKQKINEIEDKEKKLQKKLMITAIIIGIIIAFAVLLVTVIIPTIKKYNFISRYSQEVYDKFGLVDKGSTINFGTYEQDNNLSNGKEDIEWEVLDIQDGKALVISKYGLDCQKYNSKFEEVTWETCSIRSWLNKIFYNNAFSSDEQSMIDESTVTADANPDFNTDPGNETIDKLFLLSATEAKKYFNSDSKRVCTPTAYVAESYTETNAYYWWLRTPGKDGSYAAYVDDSGKIISYGIEVAYVYRIGLGVLTYNEINFKKIVRPAMWINLES